MPPVAPAPADPAANQAANSRAQAQAAQTNAEIANNNARGARLAANANEEAARRKSSYSRGQQRAAIGQAGIAYEGSALDVLGQSAANAELDALNIRYRGDLDATNYLNQAGLYQAQKQGALLSADNAEEAGLYGAATSLLGGAAKMT